MATAPITDPYASLGFIRNPDGSFTRKTEAPPEKTTTAPISAYAGDPHLLVKDIPINQSHGTWFRLFLPREAVESSSSPTIPKLPLIIYFHGGGFVAYSAASTIWDNSYRSVTTKIPTAFATVEYRLAPEHKLPAAYDDGMEALEWIKNSQDDWITKYVDLSNTFVSGTSAGGNLAFQLGLRVASSLIDDLKPLKIKGFILIQPFFGGKESTESELRSVNDQRLPPIVVDALWELCLPVGFDRDHEYCNPILGMKSDQFDKIKALDWKFLVTGHYGDPLIDRQMEFVKVVKEKGVPIVGKFLDGGYHGVEVHDPSKLEILVQEIKDFVSQSID